MKKTTLIFIFFTHLICAQTPCSNGKAGEYPCNGYDLLSNVPVNILANTNGNPEGSDIWGWTDPLTGKEYAIVGTTNSTAFVDISDPVNPIFLGRVRTANGQTSFWRDVKIYNNYAFIVADSVSSSVDQTYRARHPVFAAEMQKAAAGQNESVGVQVLGVVESNKPLNVEYAPDHPMADGDGYIYKPNVNVIEEMTNMISASRSYQTNVQLAESAKNMLNKTLQLGK